MSIVTHGVADAVVARGPSPSVWKDCPSEAFDKDASLGVRYFNDFKQTVVGGTTLVLGVGNRTDLALSWL